jgi:hypothetical protein
MMVMRDKTAATTNYHSSAAETEKGRKRHNLKSITNYRDAAERKERVLMRVALFPTTLPEVRARNKRFASSHLSFEPFLWKSKKSKPPFDNIK